MSKKSKKAKASNIKSRDQPAREMSRALTIGLASFVGLFAFALYINTLGHDYVLDDYAVIVNNEFTQQGFGGIHDIITHAYWSGKDERYAHGTYRPMSLVMFALEHHHFGNSPHVGHFVNILLYALTGGLLFLVLTKMLKKEHLLLSLTASLLFVAHPVHSEVVANIKGRDDLLSFLFLLLMILSFLRYAQHRKPIHVLAGSVAFFLALLSKENAVTYLAVIPLTLYFFALSKRGVLLRSTLALLAVLIAYVALRVLVLGDEAALRSEATLLPINNVLYESTGIHQHLATASLILGKYIRLLVIPHPLVHFYSFGQVSLVTFSDARALLSLGVAVAAISYAVITFRRKSVIAYAILLFFVTYSVTANVFFKMGATMAERFMYVPSLGFCLLLSVLLIRTTRLTSGVPMKSSFFRSLREHLAFVLVVSVILIALTTRAVARSSAWKDNHRLFLSDLKQVPQNPMIVQNYYKAIAAYADSEKDPLQRNSRLDEAIELINASAELFHEDPISNHYLGRECYFALGRLHEERGHYEKALVSYEYALTLDPANPRTHFRMGMILDSEAKYQEAITSYLRAIEYLPSYKEAHYNLGNTYTRTNDLDAAISAYVNAVKADPLYAKAYANLGIVYHRLGDAEKSRRLIDKALQIDRTLEAEINRLINE